MRQANKEARATVAALACIIVVWLVGGFGLAGTDIWLFHTPLWVIGGCVAPWIAAIVAAVVLSRRVFADFDLDEVAGSCTIGTVDAPGGARGAGRSGGPHAGIRSAEPPVAVAADGGRQAVGTGRAHP